MIVSLLVSSDGWTLSGDVVQVSISLGTHVICRTDYRLIGEVIRVCVGMVFCILAETDFKKEIQFK